MFLTNVFKNFFSFIFNFKISEIRQAWRASIVCIVCLYVNHKWLKGEYPGWVLVTAIVCLQSNFGATLKRAKQRVLGTVLGCALAFLLTYLFPDNVTISVILLLISLLLAIYNSVYNNNSYTYTVFFFTFGLIALISALFHNGAEFAILRIEDVALGALIGTLGSFLLWPDFAKKTFKDDLLHVVSELENLFQFIINWSAGEIKEEKVYIQKVLSATNNQNARIKISEIYHELGKKNYPLKEYEDFILSQERIHFSLLNIYNSLRINSYEKRKESLPFVYEQLNSIQNYFRICVARLPLSKEKAVVLMGTVDELKLLENLEKEAIKNLYDHRGKTTSFDMIKYRALLIRLLQEVKSMNLEINKILEYYVQPRP
jgi:uncharacterized membrane protein YgaE (UPF0421/DUF939 family)